MPGSVAILAFTLITVLIGHIALAAGDNLGIVLLHGKGGSPSGYVRELASALQRNGHLVSTPTMPWAENRIYDASFDEAMLEIDREIDSLRQKGAKFIVVAGHSLGANAALGYASLRMAPAGLLRWLPPTRQTWRHLSKAWGMTSDVQKIWLRRVKRKRNPLSDVNQGRSFELRRALKSISVGLIRTDPP